MMSFCPLAARPPQMMDTTARTAIAHLAEADGPGSIRRHSTIIP